MNTPIHSPQQNTPDLHSSFLHMLPRIERHARFHFRHVRCPQRKDDAIAETVGIAWCWVVRLAARGKDARNFVSTLATLAALAVRNGRRLCGQEKAGDVLSPRAQRRRGFAVVRMPDDAAPDRNPLSDALIDNTRTPPDDQAVFRIDFPAWLTSFDARRRRVIEWLMKGERTADVASRHGCSPARISQLRREFMRDWHRFCGEPS